MMQADREWKLRESSGSYECISKGTTFESDDGQSGDLENNVRRIRANERTVLFALIAATPNRSDYDARGVCDRILEIGFIVRASRAPNSPRLTPSRFCRLQSSPESDENQLAEDRASA
jgi:hypothetical protein